MLHTNGQQSALTCSSFHLLHQRLMGARAGGQGAQGNQQQYKGQRAAAGRAHKGGGRHRLATEQGRA